MRWSPDMDRKRPLTVTIVAAVYLLVGAAGFIFHFRELMPLQRHATLIEFTELLALVAGVFMFQGQNWARWLALAWIAFHCGNQRLSSCSRTLGARGLLRGHFLDTAAAASRAIFPPG